MLRELLTKLFPSVKWMSAPNQPSLHLCRFVVDVAIDSQEVKGMDPSQLFGFVANRIVSCVENELVQKADMPTYCQKTTVSGD